MTFNAPGSEFPYLTTTTWFPEDFESFRRKFVDIYRNIANCNNARQLGLFYQIETQATEKWFDLTDSQKTRASFRTVYSYTTPIAAGGVVNIPHNIAQVTTFTHIYGTCVTNVPDYRPLPFVSITAANAGIQVLCTPTNIVITNGAAAPQINSLIVILEYLKT